MHLIHRWENLEEQWINRFDCVGYGGIHKIACQIRKCRSCGKYQYKHKTLGHWTDCEISGRSEQFELCEVGFRVGRGLAGDIAPDFNGAIKVDPVNGR